MYVYCIAQVMKKVFMMRNSISYVRCISATMTSCTTWIGKLLLLMISPFMTKVVPKHFTHIVQYYAGSHNICHIFQLNLVSLKDIAIVLLIGRRHFLPPFLLDSGDS